jgi:hypothetical protein
MMICELIEKFVVFVSPDRTPLVSTPYDARRAGRLGLPEFCPLARATHQAKTSQ